MMILPDQRGLETIAVWIYTGRASAGINPCLVNPSKCFPDEVGTLCESLIMPAL